MITRNKRGGVLVTAVVLATGVALALGTFVSLCVQTSRLSNSSFNANSALNLAEAALEEAMIAVNKGDWSGWSSFKGSGSNLTKVLPTFDLGSGMTGVAQVVVFGPHISPTPRIVAQGHVNGTLGSSVTKQIEVQLFRSSLFPDGPQGRELVSFSGGNAMIDSFDSDSETYSTGGQYDPLKRKDGGQIASLRVLATSDGVALGNAKIWGYVFTRGADIDVGPNGEIRGASTPDGVKIDTSRTTKDYPARELKLKPLPTGLTPAGSITGTTSLTSGKYDLGAITLNNSSEVLTIDGDVEMVVRGEVNVKGGIVISPGASLKMHVYGNVDIGGNGVVNATNIAANAQIYGFNPTDGAQTVKLHGNGMLIAAVYAPNANIELKGGGSSGSMSGTFTGYNVKITGNYELHYDEALKRLNDGQPFSVGSWLELTSASSRIQF